MKAINYIGLDVDSKGFSVACFNQDSGELIETRLRPGFKPLHTWLMKIPGKKVLCYEAGYLGYSLQRDLTKAGYECKVIAPSLVPELKGNRVKTDRLDAAKLARYLAGGLLTEVHVPDEADEALRTLLRSRQGIVTQLTQVKNRINGLCRTLGWDFKEEKSQRCYWTTLHMAWLNEKLGSSLQPMTAMNLELLLLQKKQLEDLIQKYEQIIESVAKEPRYKKAYQALTVYRAISTTSAMTLIAELGDIRRFSKPRQLTSYIGLDIAEYSSGGQHHRHGITRLGNSHIRRTLVEATQYALNPPKISRNLIKRREGVDPNLVEIADRAMQRLHQKGTRLLYAGKHKNKVKVAMARELIGFIWESLGQAYEEKKRVSREGMVRVRKAHGQPTVGTLG